jgi:hypothetical protein
MQRRSVLALLGATTLFGVAAPLRAKPKARAPGGISEKPAPEAPEKPDTVLEVSVLHGTREAKDPDARVGNMPELREGPFAKYPSYELLKRSQLRLARGDRRQLKLPNGRLLEARLEARLPDGSSRLVASINRPGASDFLPLLEVKAKPGQSFIVAGQTYKRGILVLVFKVVR